MKVILIIMVVFIHNRKINKKSCSNNQGWKIKWERNVLRKKDGEKKGKKEKEIDVTKMCKSLRAK